MSYFQMDHARWLEENNRLLRQRLGRTPRKAALAWEIPETLSPFQAKVADIIGMTFGGIYNVPISWERAEWKYGGSGMSVVITPCARLATFDFSCLTTLVFLCHEARIRCEISSGGPKGFRLSFWQRRVEGAMHDRHPNLDEAVAAFRAILPDGHRIHYRDAETADA